MRQFRNPIPVTDRHGDRLSLYQRIEEVKVPVLGIRRKVIRYELDTGEQVQFVAHRTFKIISSGEELTLTE